MSFFEFPHTRTYDSDLGFIIAKLRLLVDEYGTINAWMTEHKYEYEQLRNDVDGLIHNLVDVIVPWDSSIAYHIFSIVEYQGTNYIAVQDVPVGAMITNTDYWQPANTVTEQINAMSVIVSNLEKWKELRTIMPQDFGAKGDGETDDSAAFQAAIDYMYNEYNSSVYQADWNQRSGCLYIPHGTYKIDSPIILREGTRILGESEDSVKIVFPSGTNINYLINQEETRYYRNIKIENVSFTNGSVVLKKAYKSLLRNVGLYSTSGDALTIIDPVGMTLEQIHIYGASGTALHITSEDQNATTFYADGLWIAHVGTGIVIDPAISLEGCMIRNTIIEYCSVGTGELRAGNIDNSEVVFENWYVEANNSPFYVYDSSLTVKDFFSVYANNPASTDRPDIRLKNANQSWTAKDIFFNVKGLVYIDGDVTASATALGVSNFYNETSSKKSQDLVDVAKGNTQNQTPGTKVTIAMNSACVSVTENRLYCCVPFPFRTKNVNYDINIVNASVVNVGEVTGSVSSKNYNSVALNLDKTNGFTVNRSYWVNGTIEVTFR